MITARHLLAAAALTVAATLPAAAEKWDMPMAYSASNFRCPDLGGESSSPI